MSRRNSQDVALLSQEEQEREIKTGPFDVEQDAGRPEPPKDQNLDHEYSIPSTVKFAWLGTYFFFSLLLTLYNKLVLGMVSWQNNIGSQTRRGRLARPLGADGKLLSRGPRLEKTMS